MYKEEEANLVLKRSRQAGERNRKEELSVEIRENIEVLLVERADKESSTNYWLPQGRT